MIEVGQMCNSEEEAFDIVAFSEDEYSSALKRGDIFRDSEGFLMLKKNSENGRRTIVFLKSVGS